LGPTHLPGFVQEGAVIDPRPCDRRREPVARVVFLSSDDESTTATVAALVERLGYAPVSLGKIAEGGQFVQARDKSWAPLIFQDLFKKDK
jgi:predicted dinucleotide-binding enzyme